MDAKSIDVACRSSRKLDHMLGNGVFRAPCTECSECSDFLSPLNSYLIHAVNTLIHESRSPSARARVHVWMRIEDHCIHCSHCMTAPNSCSLPLAQSRRGGHPISNRQLAPCVDDLPLASYDP